MQEREQEQKKKKICSAIYYSISDPTRDVVWLGKEGETFGRKKEETKTKEKREVEGR